MQDNHAMLVEVELQELEVLPEREALSAFQGFQFGDANTQYNEFPTVSG